MNKRRREASRRGGFTLIEVLLVLVILVVLGSLVGVGISGARKKSLLKAAKAQVSLFETPLATYELDMNAYPTTAQGLEALRTAPSDAKNAAKWGPAYMDKKIPLDPWGNPYQYMFPGKKNAQSYDVWSMGPDGVDGTDDDIGNWN